MSLPRCAQILREFRPYVGPSGRPIPDTFLSRHDVADALKPLSASFLPAGFAPSPDVPCTQKLSQEELQHVVAAFDAMMLFQPLAEKIDTGSHTLRNLMINAWDGGVTQWLLFFYNGGKDICSTIANRPPPFRFSIVDCNIVCYGTLKSITLCTALCKRTINSPDLLAMLGYIWVDNPSLTKRGLPADFVNDELTVAIENLQIDDTKPRGNPASSFSIVFTAAERHTSAKAVMTAVTKHIERLTRSVAKDPTFSDDLAKAAEIIGSMGKVDSLRDALHEVGLLPAVVNAIAALTDALERWEMNVQKSTAIAKAAELLAGLVLIDHLLSGYGVKSLIKAVEAGLVSTLWNAHWTFDDNFSDCVSAIRDVVQFSLGPSLVFRSVLHAVELDINRSGMLKDMRSAAIEEADEAWCDFSDFYSDMLNNRDEIDEAEMNMKCARRECPTRANPQSVKLKRCSKCQYTRYCSAECQKLHWTEHRKWCKPEDFDNGEFDIHPISDREFARNLAEWEASSRIDYLKENMPPGESDVMIIIDFTTMNKFVKIGFVPPRAEYPMAPGHKRMIGIHARVQFGRKQIDTLGAVSNWEEFEANAVPMEERVWYLPGQDGSPLPKSVARMQEAKTALVVPSTSSDKKKKKKKKGKKH